MTRKNHHRNFLLLLLVLGLIALPRLGWAVMKLYLKDGTYQLVKTYEIKGDRVRYYSLERSQWEEIPAALVDFDATLKAQAEQRAEEEKELKEAEKVENERFERTGVAGYEVAPGIHLPGDAGVFAFDGVRVVRLAQTPAEVVRDKKRMALVLALPAPVVKNRSLVILPGPKAAVRIEALQPTFYVQSSDNIGARLDLLPLKPGKSARIVEKVQRGIGLGKSGELRDTIPLERGQVAPNIYKLKPSNPLPLGEYALGELVEEKLNLELWDFGVEGAPQPAPASDVPPVIRRSKEPPHD